MESKRGFFIVIEGCDRSGKSTQCELLVNRLNRSDMPAELFKFPDRTTQTGKMIDSYLQQKSELDDHAIHLLFSANRWEAMKSIEEKLNSGINIIVDRYAFSGVAFSSAKGLDLQWCKNPDIGLLSPDFVYFLDLDIDQAEKRGGFGQERYEKRDLQIKVREQFMKMKEENWKIFDASKTQDEVRNDIWIEMGKTPFKSKDIQYSLWK